MEENFRKFNFTIFLNFILFDLVDKKDFCLDDANLTKSVQVSSLKQNATKCVNQELENVTKNVLDQKSSNLCVPISVATLLRFAIKNDLGFKDKLDFYSAESILSTLIIITVHNNDSGSIPFA